MTSVEEMAERLQINTAMLYELAAESNAYTERMLRQYMAQKQQRALAHLRNIARKTGR